MNNQELAEKIHHSIDRQCDKRGFASPVDVLIDLQILQKSRYDEWRNGRIGYLERVCTANLNKLAFILGEIESYCTKCGLKHSYTEYMQHGKTKQKLRFSKYGNPKTENSYSTHYVKS